MAAPSSWKTPIDSPRRSISKVCSSSSGDVVDVGARPGRLLDEVERHLDHREVAQPEEVHLQQAELLDAVHLVLGDDRRVARVRARLGLALDRQVLGERLVGDDDRGGVDAVLAAQALEAPGDVDHLLRVGVLLVHLAQVGRGDVAVLVALDALEAGRERGVAPHDERRHGLGDPVAEGVGQPSTRAASRTAARALIVENVTIWATWSQP